MFQLKFGKLDLFYNYFQHSLKFVLSPREGKGESKEFSASESQSREDEVKSCVACAYVSSILQTFRSDSFILFSFGRTFFRNANFISNSVVARIALCHCSIGSVFVTKKDVQTSLSYESTASGSSTTPRRRQCA